MPRLNSRCLFFLKPSTLLVMNKFDIMFQMTMKLNKVLENQEKILRRLDDVEYDTEMIAEHFDLYEDE